MQNFIGKALYALLFLALIPAGLWAWAYFTASIISLPGIRSQIIGTIMIATGTILMFWSMYLLKVIGNGLPMNAFPPTHLVITGPYRLFRHPIYVGFGLLLTGISLITGSASALWLVTPLTILAMIALVLGYESIDLQKRFPDYKMTTVFDLAANSDEVLQVRSRLPGMVYMIGLVLLSNLFMLWFYSPNRIEIALTTLPDGLSLFQLAGLIGISLIPFSLRSQKALRHWLMASILAISLMIFTRLFFPGAAEVLWPKPNTTYSVPVVLFLVSISTLWHYKRKLAFWLSPLLVAAVFVQLYFSDAPLFYGLWSVLLFWLTYWYARWWLRMKRGAESIANSWKEWTIGKTRIINHGFYVGAAAFIGILQAGLLAGREYAFAILSFAIIVTICSALWAQIVEGSEKLKRPFGYYGGLIGILLGSLVVNVMGYNAWVIIGLFSVAMPWVQAIGRLRCLVNGCCHGSRTVNQNIGIRYFHPRSRVCHISGAKGELLHPTPLYSILWLTVVGFVQLSLWQHHYSYTFIFGLYLILTSIGRFAEEAYRGEVQTIYFKGLRLYQWTALVALLTGIGMTVIRIPVNIGLYPGFNIETLVAALLGGAFLTFAMGIDFPHSNIRFSRLV